MMRSSHLPRGIATSFRGHFPAQRKIMEES